MAGDRRAGGAEHAARVNAAADLLDAGMAGGGGGPRAGWPAGLLGPAGPPVCRPGRGRRAGAGPEPAAVFTVRLPGRLAAAVREHARMSGRTISAVVAQALEEFLASGRRDRPRR